MKRKYKDYPRTYERVFTDEGLLRRNKPKGMSTTYKGGYTKYVEKFKEFRDANDRQFFDSIVRLMWLKKKLYYKRRMSLGNVRSGFKMSAMFRTFILSEVGFEYKMYSETFFFSKISSYFDDIFSGFNEHNPFEEPEHYKYPYKNITLAHMTAVYQMDERLEILKKADDENMPYCEFLDFVINYALSANEESPRDIFEIKRGKKNTLPFYIKNIRSERNKHLKPKKYERGKLAE